MELALARGFASGLSRVLLAELAVGRIILARKPSLTGLVVPISLPRELALTRELGRSAAGWAASEGRDDCLRTEDAVGVFARGPAGADLRVEGFLARVVLVRPVEGGEFPSLAADAWVEAVIEAGKRTGFVGDLGRGLTKGGLMAVAGFVFSCEGVPPRVDRAVGFVAGLSDARLGLRTGAVVRSLAASRGKGGLLELAALVVVEVAAGVACLVDVLVLVEPTVDGRFLTVCEGALSFSVGADVVVDSFCRTGSSFGLESASVAGAGRFSLLEPFWAVIWGVCFAGSSGDSFWMLSWPPLGEGDATLSRPDTTLSPLPILGPKRSAAPSSRPLAFLKGEAWLD